MPGTKRLLALDLCCGAGGWACAARGLPIEFVAVVDIAEECIETWRVNHAATPAHPDCHLICGDLTDANTHRLIKDAIDGRKVDLVLGGIPCEQVSIARNSTPISSDTMATWHKLIDSMFGLVAKLKPAFWCFEDVVEVRPHLPCQLDHGIPWQFEVLHSEDYGSAQARKRAFIGDFPVPAPVPENERRTLKDCLLPGPWLCVAHQETYGVVTQKSSRSGRIGRDLVRLLDPEMPSPTIVSSLYRGSRQRRAFQIEAPSGKIRDISWQEAALLQGFPRDYLFATTMTGAAQMIGRAIPIEVGRAILNEVVRAEKGRWQK